VVCNPRRNALLKEGSKSDKNAPVAVQRLARATPEPTARNRAGRGDISGGWLAPSLPATRRLKMTHLHTRTRGCSFVPLKSFLAKCHNSHVVLRTSLTNANDFPNRNARSESCGGPACPTCPHEIFVRHSQRRGHRRGGGRQGIPLWCGAGAGSETPGAQLYF
jgi:hypothetical protein